LISSLISSMVKKVMSYICKIMLAVMLAGSLRMREMELPDNSSHAASSWSSLALDSDISLSIRGLLDRCIGAFLLVFE